MLSVRLPWARLLVRRTSSPLGTKNIENRTWPTKYRGPIGIHASNALDRSQYEGANWGDVDVAMLAEDERLRGLVLGLVNIVGCHRELSADCARAGCHENPWAQWSNPLDPANRKPVYHWETANPRELVTPFKARGALQLWEPDGTIQHRLMIGEFL